MVLIVWRASSAARQEVVIIISVRVIDVLVYRNNGDTYDQGLQRAIKSSAKSASSLYSWRCVIYPELQHIVIINCFRLTRTAFELIYPFGQLLFYLLNVIGIRICFVC